MAARLLPRRDLARHAKGAVVLSYENWLGAAVYVNSTGADRHALEQRRRQLPGQFTKSTNPQTVLVKSSLGGSATEIVTAMQARGR
jgi:hypothetical protein